MLCQLSYTGSCFQSNRGRRRFERTAAILRSPAARFAHLTAERGSEVQEAIDLLPWPLMLAVMGLGVALVLAACLPTAWVDRLVRFLHKRFGEPAS